LLQVLNTLLLQVGAVAAVTGALAVVVAVLELQQDYQ
jgi:hypothetical protein